MKFSIEKFIQEILSQEKALQEETNLENYKKIYSKKYADFFVKNAEIRKIYDKMIQKKEIAPNQQFEKILTARKIRSLSGVAVVAILTKPFPCPGDCLYCPTEKNVPKSYLPNEPVAMRALSWNFHPYKQVHSRMQALYLNGHSTDKIELIVMGGTFSFLPKKYQTWFIKECFRAVNDFPENKIALRKNSSLEKEQTKNEKAQSRIVALTLETRPDYISQKEIERMRKMGATKVELGVQTVFDDVLKKNHRGHLTKEVASATKILKNAGFKIGYHLMPGLFGSNLKKDLRMFEIIFSDSRFMPDLIKIYPCVVMENSELFEFWKKGKYCPLSNKETLDLMIRIKKIIPPFVRISRLIRDIPSNSIIAGPNITNLRQLIQEKGSFCQCIRCREIKNKYSEEDKLILDRIDYEASGGKEIFLQFVSLDKKKLYALLRLRIFKSNSKKFKAIIREVHTYGKAIPIGEKNKKAPQHIGLGKKLLQEGEKIAKKEFGISKISVISAIGARNYYHKLGYILEKTYMIKKLP